MAYSCILLIMWFTALQLYLLFFPKKSYNYCCLNLATTIRTLVFTIENILKWWYLLIHKWANLLNFVCKFMSFSFSFISGSWVLTHWFLYPL
jgi:hypothetical protein